MSDLASYVLLHTYIGCCAIYLLKILQLYYFTIPTLVHKNATRSLSYKADEYSERSGLLPLGNIKNVAHISLLLQWCCLRNRLIFIFLPEGLSCGLVLRLMIYLRIDG